MEMKYDEKRLDGGKLPYGEKPSHGGNLLQIARHYQTDVKDWIDLSTGVSPFTYPVGDLPESVWNQLPQTHDGLESAAKLYYNAPVEPVAVSGSQAAIMALPSLLTETRGRCGVVALPRVGYKEHVHAWCRFESNGFESNGFESNGFESNGFESSRSENNSSENNSSENNQARWSVLFYDDMPTAAQIQQSDVVVMINPNNPTGQSYDRDVLLKLRAELARHHGTLIIDEAFVDAKPETSVLTPSVDMDNLIVLRSVGKFFGLAGARVGFVFASHSLRHLLEDYIGPWTVAGPSRWVMKQALADVSWQQQTRERIQQTADRLAQLLEIYLPFPMAGTALFKTVYLDDAVKCHDLLCQAQVLTRLCDEKNAIRVGLPANEMQWKKLEAAFIQLSQQVNQ